MKRLDSNKSMILPLIYIQFIVFVFLMIFPVLSREEFSVDLSQTLLIVVFFECAFLSLLGKTFNVYQVFLLMMFLFCLALPILSEFDLYSYPSGNRIMLTDGMTTIVNNKVLTETYIVLMTMLLGSSIGWLVGMLRLNMNIKRQEFLIPIKKYAGKYRNNIKKFFFILLGLVIYKNLILVYYSTIYGYVEVMHLKSINLNTNILLIIADMLFKMSGYALLFMSRNNKEYIKYSILFMIPYLIQIGTGARGETIAILLTVVFIYSQFYNQLKFRKIIPLGVVVFTLSIVLGAFRFSRDLGSIFSSTSIINLMVLGLVSSSSSIGVIAYTIQLKDEFFNSVPFLFGYVQGIFSFAPNYTIEGIENKNYLAQHVTYLINPNKLFGGSTIGTSMGAEFYEFSNGNMFTIFILSTVLLYGACYFISRLSKNIIMFYIGAFYLELLWISPRGSIMKIFSKESLFSLTILILILQLSRIAKIQNKESR
jgi:hypothetical protein